MPRRAGHRKQAGIDRRRIISYTKVQDAHQSARESTVRPVARLAKKAPRSESTRRPKPQANDVEEILKILVFLYTENRRFTKQLAARASLTGPQLTVVKMLETMGDLSLSELSDAIRAQNSTVTGIVDRMEREEIVERVRSTEDRRVVRIHLTEKGRKLAAEIPIEPVSIFRDALASLSANEAHELLKMVNKISTRVRAAIVAGMGEDGEVDLTTFDVDTRAPAKNVED